MYRSLSRLSALFTCLLLMATAVPALADLRRYTLEPDAATVRFTYQLAGQSVTGTMPVRSTDLAINFDRLEASNVRVTLDAAKARAGFILATEALRSRSVLDTDRHPIITFVSTDVTGTTSQARLTGNLTIKGNTRPTALTGGVFRLAGRDPRNLDVLTIVLRGRVSRSAFGATGYPDIVGDPIDLAITAQIRRIGGE